MGKHYTKSQRCQQLKSGGSTIRFLEMEKYIFFFKNKKLKYNNCNTFSSIQKTQHHFSAIVIIQQFI
jgi:hypothetical protein